MNKDEIEKIKNKITEFENQDVFIKIEKSIQYHTVIKKAKIIVSDQKLIISDGKEQDFIMELFYIEEVEVEGNSIYMSMSNDISITIDY